MKSWIMSHYLKIENKKVIKLLKEAKKQNKTKKSSRKLNATFDVYYSFSR